VRRKQSEEFSVPAAHVENAFDVGRNLRVGTGDPVLERERGVGLIQLVPMLEEGAFQVAHALATSGER
jgi:hypothetical protein